MTIDISRCRLPEGGRYRCALLQENEHAVILPFKDAENLPVKDLTPRLPEMTRQPRPTSFLGREVACFMLKIAVYDWSQSHIGMFPLAKA